MSLPPLFEQISTSEGWSLQQLQQAWAFIPLGSGVVALATGAVLQRRADRPILIVAGVLSVVAILMRAIASGALSFSLALLLFGIGTGAILVTLTSRVSRLFAGEGAGLAQAAFFGAYTVGAALGLATADVLSNWLGGWRLVPVVWASVSAIALVPALRTSLPPSARPSNVRQEIPPPPGWKRGVARYAFVYAAYVGGYLGLIGLLPYQLRRWGWDALHADGVLALSTVGFVVGAFLWAVFTDRYGCRRPAFVGCMLAAAVLTLCAPIAATGGPHFWAGVAVVGVGFFSGAMALFFPILLDDPRTGGTRAPQSIGLTTAASYAGGFLIPFSLAPLSDAWPSFVLAMYAIAFACAGAAMLGGTSRAT